MCPLCSTNRTQNVVYKYLICDKQRGKIDLVKLCSKWFIAFTNKLGLNKCNFLSTINTIHSAASCHSKRWPNILDSTYIYIPGEQNWMAKSINLNDVTILWEIFKWILRYIINLFAQRRHEHCLILECMSNKRLLLSNAPRDMNLEFSIEFLRERRQYYWIWDWIKPSQSTKFMSINEYMFFIVSLPLSFSAKKNDT